MAMSSLDKLLEKEPQKRQHLEPGAKEDPSVALAMATDLLYRTNRRQTRRMPMHGCKMRVKAVTPTDTNWIDATAEDFSSGGVRFIAQSNFRRDESVWIHITPDFAATNIRPFQVQAIGDQGLAQIGRLLL